MNENKPTAGDGNEGGGMPNIAELLEKEDEDFVSLHELLTAMAEGFHATYQDAARLLLRRLKNTDEDDRPAWCRLDLDHGIVAIGSGQESGPWTCLRQAAANGEPQNDPPPEDFDDDIPF